MKEHVSHLVPRIWLDLRHLRFLLAVGGAIDVVVAPIGCWGEERTEHPVVGAVLEHQEHYVLYWVGADNRNLLFNFHNVLLLRFVYKPFNYVYVYNDFDKILIFNFNQSL